MKQTQTKEKKHTKTIKKEWKQMKQGKGNTDALLSPGVNPLKGSPMSSCEKLGT
jgi:hypothetical protein